MIDLNNSDQKTIQVSVYCLAYNHEKYIKKTLEGFVNQETRFGYEILIHDDASTDRTPKIIQEYVDNYPAIIKPIFQKENQYSKGIKMMTVYLLPRMKGRYIASCEGDDYWNDPYKLQKQFDAMETHPECSLSTHLVRCCNEDGSPNTRVIPEQYYKIEGSRVIEKEELAQCYWIRGNYPFHTSSYFYRRKILDMVLDYPRDVGILRKCFIEGSMYYIDEPMSTRRLWSLGNWNSRLKEGGVESRWKLALDVDAAEDRFDLYTKYAYHDYVSFARMNRFLEFIKSAQYRKKAKKVLRQYELSPWKIKKKLSLATFLKLQAKYTLGMYFSGCYSGIQKLWWMFMGYHET